MKRILSLVLIMTIMLATIFVPTAANAETTGTYGDLEYTNYGDHIEITRCNNKLAESVEIPAEMEGLPVTSIGNDAFSCCYRLTDITIPDSITFIGDYAFGDCDSLINITIPDSVTSIEDYAFYGCDRLTNIIIPDSVISIGMYAFSDCTGLINIIVDSNNEYYYSLNGNLFNKDQTELIQYATGKPESFYAIPDSVTSIDIWAFSGCDSLTDITVDRNNKYYSSLNGNLFNKDQTEFILYAPGKPESFFAIPTGVISIGYRAFAGCYSLTDITIPDSVTSIGEVAFAGCQSLTEIIIPKSVTSIGNAAFYVCQSLSDVYYSGSKDQWQSIDIGGNNDPLLNANIHYNSPIPGEATATPAPTPTQEPTPAPTPMGDPNAPLVEIVKVSDYSVEVKVNNCDDTDAQVILAVYNKNGALIEMQNDHNSGEVTFLSENLQNVNIKVMLWSGMDGIKPLAAEPAELNL